MQSLRVKLIAPFVAGTLALTLLLGWYTYTSARQAVEDAMLLISEAKTNQALSSMSLLLKSMRTALQNMVADPHVTALFAPSDDREEMRSRAEDWLQIVTQGNEYYRDILVVDKMGVCIASSNSGQVGTSYASKSYVLEALSGRFTLGEASVGRVTKKFSAAMAGPVDAGGEMEGALITLNDFPKVVDYDTGLTHDAQIAFTSMIAPDGVFMAHKDKALMGNEDRRFPELYQHLAQAGERGGTVSYQLLGHAYIGYAKVEPSTKWVVLTSGKESEVFAPAYKVGLVVLGLSSLFLCGISFVVIRFANGILSSLLSLITYAKQVSEGDLERDLEATSRTDELGVLHTSLQRLVLALRTMLIETRQASKMKGEFLANMSHEIRTPLNAIIGMSHLALREKELPARPRGFIDKIQLAARALLGLINDILDLSKVEAGMIELEHIAFDLHAVVADTVTIHQESARAKSLRLGFMYAPDVPRYFIGDPLRVGQILNNLLSNAIKFTKEGSVTVTCTRDAINPGDGRAAMRVSVADTGIGISRENIDTLFQPFTQEDASITRQFGGTGLGLAISDKLVRLLGGRFRVDSEPGKGTDFSFSMFLTPDPDGASRAEQPADLNAAFEHLGLEGKSILVAEDNAINQMIMQELLEPSGARVVLVENGEEAVEAARTEHFDLVFMDLQMPVMDGLEATRHIREFKGPDVLPIVAVTANAMREDKEKGFASGMNDYITKPIEPGHLLTMLRTWLKPV